LNDVTYLTDVYIFYSENQKRRAYLEEKEFKNIFLVLLETQKPLKPIIAKITLSSGSNPESVCED
jgi:hypothetical protein